MRLSVIVIFWKFSYVAKLHGLIYLILLPCNVSFSGDSNYGICEDSNSNLPGESYTNLQDSNSTVGFSEVRAM